MLSKLPDHLRSTIAILVIVFMFSQCTSHKSTGLVKVAKDDHIIVIGGNLGSRMMNYGYFETEVHIRFPDSTLYIRNMCDAGDTPGFRAHSGRNDPWAFPGAEKFQTELAKKSGSVGHLEKPDEWLTRHGADVIVAMFGFSASFEGKPGVKNFKAELTAFVKHTKAQKYNGESTPSLVLVSPTSFEDLTNDFDIPNGVKENENLALYSQAIADVAMANNVPFVDAFGPSKKWMKNTKEPLTIDGVQLNEKGYEKFSALLANQVFGGKQQSGPDWKNLQAAVKEKNWFWHNDFKIPNGVHVFGRRYDPFGPDNYPFELAKVREMTANRDTAIWMTAQGKTYDLAVADSKTTKLPEVESNYKPGDYGRGKNTYLYGEEAESTIKVPPGYKVELFASEKEFEDLANPVQLSFDNKGRLWVAVMPTYPHYKPGDARPNDKLIILEDTDGDGKADKQTTFADGLHIPVGFELAPEGVYVSQGTNLKLLTDTDGDDRADREEIIMSGFDDHDTHHVISAFCADPSGALYMGEGVFLHTNVETAYGTIRATNGGFYRYAPQQKKLERTAQLSIPNPWGIAFDDWGQPIFAETSGPAVRWMLPGTVKPRYATATHKSKDLIQEKNKVRPTSGLEFVSSRHFPDEVQGDMLINNSIGFLGMKQHIMKDDGTGFSTDLRHDLMVGSDKNFRPVDMEFAPDGSLYVVDWHNVLIGHMQHNARDPYRDHVHGRIFRITYPSRPLVEPAKIDNASIDQLLDNLKLPEYRSRYRTKRELRGRDVNEVFAALKPWVERLDVADERYEHHLLEALWVSWGINKLDPTILSRVLASSDFRARAAGVRVVRYMGNQLENQASLLRKAARDDHGRVRLEAIVAASWLPEAGDGLSVLAAATQKPLDDWMVHAHQTALAHLNGESLPKVVKEEAITTHLKGADFVQYKLGKKLYEQDGYCATCHQSNGKGLIAAGFPPLAGTKWVLEDEERLIKIALKGLTGPIRVASIDYKGEVAMTPYEGLLDDNEMAAVLTYVRNSFGNKASVISSKKVAKVRSEIKGKRGFYTAKELE